MCAGSPSVDRLQKRLIDTVKDCLKKRGLDVRQPRRCMIGMCGGGFVRGNEPLSLTRCHSFMKPWKGDNLSVA